MCQISCLSYSPYVLGMYGSCLYGTVTPKIPHYILPVKFFVFRLQVKVRVLLCQKHFTNHKKTSGAQCVPKEGISFVNAHCLQRSFTHKQNYINH